MNVLIFIVNFKADEYVKRLIESILEAVRFSQVVRTRIHVFDNSGKTEYQRAVFASQLIGYGVTAEFSERNLGYFGPLEAAQRLASSGPDCVIYANPDLEVDQSFFSELCAHKDPPGVIAPSIIVAHRGFDQNPKYRARLRREKLQRLRAIYSSPWAYAGFSLLAGLKERLSGGSDVKHLRTPSAGEAIYAPHGSLFVFTDVDFFKRLPPYPCFLFGEEIFVAEQALRAGVRIRYCPSMKAFDVRHASIRFLSSSARRKLMLESVNYILREYYSQ